MLPSFKEAISKLCGTNNYKLKAVSGGDINDAYLLSYGSSNIFIKVNRSSAGKANLHSEYHSLKYFSEQEGINVPHCDPPVEFIGGHILPMEYIEPGPVSHRSWESLVQQLASLHKVSNPTFGWKESNFIGSLPQSNKSSDSWIDFFILERLRPQIKLAFDSQRLTPSSLSLYENLEKQIPGIIKVEPPSLLHGDFWSGNFLVDKNQEAYLLDPSAYFGNREIDIAMSELFGGFSPIFLDTYQQIFPLAPNYQDRVPLYQLYYLLAHLNIFGKSYAGQVHEILSFYSQNK